MVIMQIDSDPLFPFMHFFLYYRAQFVNFGRKRGFELASCDLLLNIHKVYYVKYIKPKEIYILARNIFLGNNDAQSA